MPKPRVRFAAVHVDGLLAHVSRPGRFRARIGAEGGFGPGCGTARVRSSTAEKTIVIR